MDRADQKAPLREAGCPTFSTVALIHSDPIEGCLAMTITLKHVPLKSPLGYLNSLAVLFTLGTMFSAPAGALAAERQITFVNATGQDANDLHIEAQSHGVTVTAKTPFPSDRAEPGDQVHNLHGATVSSPGTALITLTSNNRDLLLKTWHWTWGGNAIRDGRIVGDYGRDDGSAVLTAGPRRSRGDGMYQVSVGGMAEIFQTRANATPAETMAEFAAFLDSFVDGDSGFDFIHSFFREPTQIVAAGNILGDPVLQLLVEVIQQDSDQPIDVAPLQEPALQTNLTYTATCPGEVTLDVTEAVPGHRIVFVYGMIAGETEVPMCESAVVSVDDPKVAGIVYASAEGYASLSGYVPPAGCGRVYVQVLDLDACWTTNTILIE